MTTETKPRRKKWKLAGGILLAVLVLLAGGFFWYVSDYYRAEGRERLFLHDKHLVTGSVPYWR